VENKADYADRMVIVPSVVERMIKVITLRECIPFDQASTLLIKICIIQQRTADEGKIKQLKK